MKRSIFYKIFSGYFLITIVLSAAILIFSLRLIRDFYIKTLASDLNKLAVTIKLKVSPYINDKKYDELDTIVKDLGEDISTRITIIRGDGVVLADSEKDPDIMENHGSRPEIVTAFSGKMGQSIRYSSTLETYMLYVTVPVGENQSENTVVRVSLFLSHIESLYRDLKIEIFQIALIVMILSIIGSFIFSKSHAKPIKELADASKKVADGEFDVKIYSQKGNEIKELADSFNYMTTRIKSLFTELSSQKEIMSRIISSLHEGILVIDKKDIINLGSKNFKNIIKNEDIESKHYWEVIRNSEFNELVNKTREGKKYSVENIELNGKYYLCSSSFLEDNEDIIITLLDITDIKNIENLKRDFVVNVSHELKTPLTAIKGYVETLEEEEKLKNKNFLEIIKRHTDRLINIVEDLLLLSQLEEKESKIELEEVYIKEVIDNIIRIFEKKISEKNLQIVLEIQDRIKVYADRYKLEQMFINLIDNAIKYTEKGEIRVVVKKENGSVLINIIDQGYGISEEYLPRIFERFYVVDKSRSRRLGGTGLGLSIVKHIVLLHRGKIDVESTPNKGTKFTILLPQKI